jgi:hypothetical protein
MYLRESSDLFILKTIVGEMMPDTQPGRSFPLYQFTQKGMTVTYRRSALTGDS